MRHHNLSVSVIIPTYNARAFLPGAIANVLEQGCDPLEIIVVDDGSDDGTAELVQALDAPVRYRFQPNRGPAAARNHGLRLAGGNIIAFLDVDDRWPANMLERQSAWFVTHPSTEIVHGLIQDVQVVPAALPPFQPLGTPYISVNVGSALFRARVFQTVGPFDESFRLNEDSDWFFRAWEQGVPKLIVDDVFLYYGKHSGNMTNRANLAQAGFVSLFKKHLDRSRARGQLDTNRTNSRPKLSEYFGWDVASRRKERRL